jgi:multiple sugar transport system substrate-binding protein
MAGQRLSRRQFVRATGAAAGAATLGANIIIPGRARAAKTLKILQWVHFVPAYDEWFNKKYVKEWGAKNDTEVTVDNIGLAQINARANAEAAAGKGHDIVQFNWPPPAFEQQVVPMNDLYQELEKKLGKPIDLCVKSTYNPKTKTYYALSPSFTPDPVNYRQDSLARSACRTGPRRGTRSGARARRSRRTPATRSASVSPRRSTPRWRCERSCTRGAPTSRTRRAT